MTTARDVVNSIRAAEQGAFALSISEAELMVNLFASCELMKSEKSALESAVGCGADRNRSGVDDDLAQRQARQQV